MSYRQSCVQGNRYYDQQPMAVLVTNNSGGCQVGTMTLPDMNGKGM